MGTLFFTLTDCFEVSKQTILLLRNKLCSSWISIGASMQVTRDDEDRLIYVALLQGLWGRRCQEDCIGLLMLM